MSKKTYTDHGHHTYTHDELESTMNFINSRLEKDDSLSFVLPIKDPEEVFEACRDGIILSKLVNIAVPDTIDDRTINYPKGGKGLNPWQMTENHNLLINSAKGIGCKLINIGTGDIKEGKPHLVLGLLWQVVKIGLSSHINLKEHPELVRLLEEGESLEDFLALPPEQIILRWFNYQLDKAGDDRRVKNFGKDISDSYCYTKLLQQIGGGTCTDAPLSETDDKERAEKMLQEADKLGCREFIFPSDVVKGNDQLNFCFVANLFNKYPSLEEVAEEDLPDDFAEMMDFDSEGSREERAFRYWMQSMGFEVNNLYKDLRDGVILLKLIDHIRPGTINWKRVSEKPRNKFAAVANQNMVIEHGKKDVGMSIVGISGANLFDGNKKLTLGVVWQLMKAHQMHLLELAGGGKKVSDQELIKWANAKVGENYTSIRSFKDKELASGQYLIYLCNGVSERSCNLDMIETGEDEDAHLMNAKYAISVARKIGATLFLLPEDIVEVNPKMLLTFFAALMLKDLEEEEEEET